jgi:hypothetical protein
MLEGDEPLESVQHLAVPSLNMQVFERKTSRSTRRNSITPRVRRSVVAKHIACSGWGKMLNRLLGCGHRCIDLLRKCRIMPLMPGEFKIITSHTAQIFAHPTWDIILLFTLLAISFFYGISKGRQKIISAIIYSYVALAVTAAVPYDPLMRVANVGDPFIVRSAVFLVTLGLLSILLGKGKGRAGAQSHLWWQIILLSVIQSGLVIHIVLSFLSPERASTLAPLTKTVFANPSLHVWWLVGPLAVLVFLRRMGRREDY